MNVFRRTALGIVAITAGACASQDLDPDITTLGADAPGWEVYLRDQVRWDPAVKAYLVEQDILMPDLDAVRRHHDAMVGAAGALIVNRHLLWDDTWDDDERHALTYCVSNAFGATHKAQLLEALRMGMGAWENAIDVRFIHVTSEDANCTNTNRNVAFNVSRAPDSFDGSAAMGYPSFARADRQFVIKWRSWEVWPDDVLLGTVLHELGHGLGFRHEHIRNPGNPNASCDGENDNYRELTVYDNLSVMHYPLHTGCVGFGDPTRAQNFLSQRDIEGAQAVYDAPTNVLNAADGTLYARERESGDIYQKTGSTWTRIGGPGQAFLTVGNTLYGQRPEGGEPVKYLGNGSWVIIGGPAGMILNCGGALCATDPATGNIARYSGGGWTVIGGAGSRFQGTSNELYAISPDQHATVRWNGPGGGGWTIIGGGASELFGGGTSMIRMNEARDNVERYQTSTGTWSSLGMFGRQFLPTNGLVYALTPDAGAVRVLVGAQWMTIGGPAARLYGSYGRLYATSPVIETIQRYDAATGTWIGEGKP